MHQMMKHCILGRGGLIRLLLRWQTIRPFANGCLFQPKPAHALVVCLKPQLARPC